MLEPISSESAVKAVLKGIVAAQIEYEKWSGGYWLWMAPEYLLTVNIAKQLGRLGKSNFLTLEHGATAAMEDAGARGRGKLHSNMRPNGRMDALLWSPQNNSPIAIIEVKNQVTHPARIAEDILRVVEMLKRAAETSTLKYGLVAFYSSCQESRRPGSQQKIQSYLESIKVEAEVIAKNLCKVEMHQSKITSVEDSSWVAAVIVFERV